MKYLFSMTVVLVFVLSSCISVPESVKEPFSTSDLQESPPAEVNTSEDAPINSIEVIGGDEESLREFIKQWQVSIYPDGSSQNIIVNIGGLPEDLPYDLPTPDNARIIGSITGSWVDYILIFDTNLTPDAIQDFYSQSLINKGWHEETVNQGQGGFVSQSGLYSGYCYEDDAFLSIETPRMSNNQTSIRLNLQTSPPLYNCEDAPAYSGTLYENLIPRLEAPNGTMIQSGGASSSDREAEVTAHLQSDSSPLQIIEFYNQQLLATGWEMQDSGDAQASENGEGAAWSHWTFTDDQNINWRGSLIVVKTSADKGSLFALLRIEKDK